MALINLYPVCCSPKVWLKVEVLSNKKFLLSTYEYFMSIQKSRDPGILFRQHQLKQLNYLRQRCIVGLATQIVNQLLTTWFHEKLLPNFHEFLHQSDYVRRKNKSCSENLVKVREFRNIQTWANVLIMSFRHGVKWWI